MTRYAEPPSIAPLFTPSETATHVPRTCNGTGASLTARKHREVLRFFDGQDPVALLLRGSTRFRYFCTRWSAMQPSRGSRRFLVSQ